MNILTAPLAFLIPPIRSGLVGGIPPGPPDPLAMMWLFLRLGTLLALVVIGGGFWFIFSGEKGDVVLSGHGFELKTGTVGLAMVAIGALLYLGIGWLIVKALKK